MINYRGIWLPDGEQHLQGWMEARNEIVDGLPSYQHHKLRRVLLEARNHGTAVDVGAHCGLWSMHLVKHFAQVLAFEPVAAHRSCFERNVRGHFVLHACCLGEAVARVAMHTDPTSSGDSYPVEGGDVNVEVFDQLYPEIEDVGLVKLDCEGYELFALRGMEAMIARCRPAVIVEQKPGKAQKYGLRETEAVDWLEGLGMRLVSEMSGDYLLAW